VPGAANPSENNKHLVVATERTAPQMANAMFVAQLRYRAIGLMFPVLLGVALWRNSPLGAWAMLLPAGAAVILVLMWRDLHQKARRLVPPGTPIQTTFTSSSLLVQSVGGSSRFPLAAMVGVRRIGACVAFRIKNNIYAYPHEVFPDEQVDRLRRG
jgi:hypothetical protein